MAWTEAVITFASACVGAIAGAVAQRYVSRGRPIVYVKSCELSSTTLSRVDYLALPKEISEKF